MKKVSIIIPAHNEEKRIKKTLEEYIIYFKNLKKKKILDFEIIVVLNACSDNTLLITKKFKKKFKEIKILDFEIGGKGFAIIKGFKDALKRKNNLIGFVDADMATPPEAFYDLVKNINNYDGVIANRWDKRSIIKTPQTTLRKIMSRVFNFLVKWVLFLNYSDTQCGAKIFKKKALGKIIVNLSITKWAFDIDLLYNLEKKGFKIKEIPTIWEDKIESKLNLTKVPLQMFLGLIRLRLVNSPFSFIVRIYNKLPEKIKVHNI